MGSPYFNFWSPSINLSLNFSYSSSSMMNLLGEKHICPQFIVLPLIAFSTDLSKSASFNTTNGSLPPSYITDFFRYSPAFEEILAPDFVLPVKLTPATDLWARILSNISYEEWRHWYSPLSNPAFLKRSSIISPKAGQLLDVLTRRQFPASKVVIPPLKVR